MRELKKPSKKKKKILSKKDRPAPKHPVSTTDVSAIVGISLEDTLKVKESIKKDAPDWVLQRDIPLQNLYIEWQWNSYLVEHNPWRSFTFPVKNSEGEEILECVDCNSPNVKNLTLLKGGSEEQANEAYEQRLNKVFPLLRILQKSKREYDKGYGMVGAAGPLQPILGDIIEWYGKYHTVGDVRKFVYDKIGYKAPETELQRIYKENRDTIEKRRNLYVLNNRSFHIATETGRLEVMNDLLTDVLIKYKRTRSVSDAQQILRILEQARKEIKGEQLKLTVDGKIDIQASLRGRDAVLNTAQQLSINSIVIGLTAAKSGLDPAVLIAQLSTSYYNGLNGFSKNLLSSQTDIISPAALIKQYDWGELEEKSEEFEESIIPIEDSLQVSEEERETSNERRHLLLQALNKMKERGCEDPLHRIDSLK